MNLIAVLRIHKYDGHIPRVQRVFPLAQNQKRIRRGLHGVLPGELGRFRGKGIPRYGVVCLPIPIALRFRWKGRRVRRLRGEARLAEQQRRLRAIQIAPKLQPQHVARRRPQKLPRTPAALVRGDGILFRLRERVVRFHHRE